MAIRSTYIDSSKIVEWLINFESKYGDLVCSCGSQDIVWESSGMNIAKAHIPYRDNVGSMNLEEAIFHLEKARNVAIILLRRGGYAVGLARSGKLCASKVGTRYVQSKTAAGGWSQKRYARRRVEQANSLVEIAQRVAVDIFKVSSNGSYSGLDGLAVGGDRELLDKFFSKKNLGYLKNLPQFPYLNIADPRLKVLQRAAVTVTMFPLSIVDPDGN